MIFGLGIDLCSIGPIKHSITRFGKDWLNEIFTIREQKKFFLHSQEVAVQAAISFALKEACSKALGTGFNEDIRPQNIVVSLKPETCLIRLNGPAKHRAFEISFPYNFIVHSDFERNENWAIALVTICSVDEKPIIWKKKTLLPI